MVNNNANILNYHWSDIILPTLYDNDLKLIKRASKNLIQPLYTEDFCRGVGLYSKKWKKTFTHLNKNL